MDSVLFNKLSTDEARLLNPLVLAFIGDAAYEVFIRSYIIAQNSELSAHKMHVKAISYVKAHAQSEILKNIEQYLTEEEIVIYKRGRNAKSSSVPKNADVTEYRKATGLEALVGFLFITDQKDRLTYILNKCINCSSMEDKNGAKS